MMHQVSVKAVDVDSKSILLSNEESLVYSHLVIATGGRYVQPFYSNASTSTTFFL